MIRRLSLTTRLTALYAVVSAIMLIGIAWFISIAVEQHFRELDEDTLHDKIELVQGIIGKARSQQELRERLDDALRNHPGLYVRIDNGEGSVWYSSTAFKPPPLADSASTQSPLRWIDSAANLQGLGTYASENSILGAQARVLAAVDTGHHAHFMAQLQQMLGIYVVLAALASGCLGWWAARVGLSPLREMKAKAQQVTANKLDQRMSAEAVPIELADLAISLNDMLARLEEDFQRLTEFSSDLAHELRTPINNLLTQTQVTLSRERDGDSYHEILASNAEELQRLSRMVADMLFLAKADHGLMLPSKEHIVLADEVQALFDFYDALAEEKGIGLQLHGNAVVQGDRLMLRRAISNLLSNALRHAAAHSTVSVTLGTEGDIARLSVRNQGATISPEVLPRLFDRFFRADKARAHLESDGVGLGLSITQAIAKAHQGQVKASSVNGETTFTIDLPSQ